MNPTPDPSEQPISAPKAVDPEFVAYATVAAAAGLVVAGISASRGQVGWALGAGALALIGVAGLIWWIRRLWAVRRYVKAGMPSEAEGASLLAAIGRPPTVVRVAAAGGDLGGVTCFAGGVYLVASVLADGSSGSAIAIAGVAAAFIAFLGWAFILGAKRLRGGEAGTLQAMAATIGGLCGAGTLRAIVDNPQENVAQFLSFAGLTVYLFGVAFLPSLGPGRKWLTAYQQAKARTIGARRGAATDVPTTGGDGGVGRDR